MWQIRADGSGLAGRTPDGHEAWPGWEDAAVPPANLGAYLREFENLLTSHRLTGIPYGHFGDGCLHIRIDLPLHKGSQGLSGIHGGGRPLGGAARRVVLRRAR